ncbi:MAG TPA: cofactor-independent phosphoglycerate mutase [Nitrospirales bacterium]|jgi:2,3-bisphosphoglycerate-independent phosphoglycerate mutase
MKYVILMGDGMADNAVAELNGQTPLQAAKTPHLDYLTQNGELGLVKTTPDGCYPGSDVTQLAILGYDPKKYCTGPAPFEAAGLDVSLNPDDVAFRCNLVTLRADTGGYDIKKLGPHAIMEDFSAGQIDSLEAKELIYDLNEQIGTEVVQFYAGVSYRHLMVWAEGKHRITISPPQDITGKSIAEYLPKGEGDKVLRALMEAALPILREHQINIDRKEAGKPPANAIWLWGQGKAPKMPKLTERYGLTGAIISALDLPRGLGLYCGLDVVKVAGATGYADTNYAGKTEAALVELKTKDFVYIHVGAADEASHQGDVQGKVKAIELFDEQTLGLLLKELPKLGSYRLLMACNHATPVASRQHTADPVPYAIFEGPTCKEGAGAERGFNEVDAKASRVYIEDAKKLIGRLLGK